MSQPRAPIRRPPRAPSAIEVANVDFGPDFESADRHSGRVRMLRWALPTIAVVGVVGYFLASGSPSVDLPIDFDNVVVDGAGVIIERPRLTGYQAGGEFYELVADRAIQRNDNPNYLLLEGVSAQYELPSGEIAFFAAPFGEYDSATTLMLLSGGATMSIGDGVNIRLESVSVDVPNTLIFSDQPFELEAGNLVVRGNGLEFTETDMRIIGGVETVFAPNGATVALPRIGITVP